MAAASNGFTMIEGRIVHKTSNALKITFSDGPGDPLAVGVQSAGDGTGAKLGVLFGFKNGGTGKHRITYSDGTIVWVQSRSGAPTVVSRADGADIATIERAEISTAISADGGTLFRFVPDPAEAKTPELFRLLVQTDAGAEVGRLDIIRTSGGWILGQIADELWNEYLWWDQAGRTLPVPILGTRLMLNRPVERVERDVLLAVCVDTAIGLRPYIAAMN